MPHHITHKIAEYRSVLSKQYISCTVPSYQKVPYVMEASFDLRINIFCAIIILHKNVLNAYYQLYFFFRGC